MKNPNLLDFKEDKELVITGAVGSPTFKIGSGVTPEPYVSRIACYFQTVNCYRLQKITTKLVRYFISALAVLVVHR